MKTSKMMMKTCHPVNSHDDTSSDSEEESTEYEGDSSGDDYVERSFQVLFIDNADIPDVV